MAGTLLYPDLVGLLIKKIAKQQFNSDLFVLSEYPVQARPFYTKRSDNPKFTKSYDIVTNVNLGQLLPKKWGIKLPFSYSIAEEIKDPKYDPQYQDVLFYLFNSKHMVLTICLYIFSIAFKYYFKSILIILN